MARPNNAVTPSPRPGLANLPVGEVVDLGETLPQEKELRAKRPPRLSDRAYLVVFEENTALTYELPASGEVVVGRAPEVALQLTDLSASRQHARLLVRSGEVLIADLGSRNGTRVNGELIDGSRVLGSGDVITICQASLIFYRQAAAPTEVSVYTVPQLRQRLQEEIDRSLRYYRPLGIVCLLFAEAPPDQAAVLALLKGQLRKMDGAAWLSRTQLLFVLPEMTIDETAATVKAMCAGLSTAVGACRGGFSACPSDGSDIDALLSGAQAAATAAVGSTPTLKAAETAKTLSLGDRRVVLVDPAMVRLYALIQKLAPSELPVLIQGETGVGKEIAALAIHHFSKRKGKPFISVNCAALPESLVESELFGHERGSFSGAVAAKTGLLETANTGTLFLDEIGELPLAIQAKLLRVLETRKLMRVGDVRERPIDVRIVAATNRDLATEIEASRFRKDLFFRLGAARLMLPPLRDRRRELPVLARALLTDACARLGREPMEISSEAMYKLAAYPFPGNVRELRNVLDFVAATVDGDVLLPWHLAEQITSPVAPFAADQPQVASPAPRKFRPIEEELRELERQRMAEALTATSGVYARAAELIAMPIRTFANKLKQYELGNRKRTPDAT